MQQLPEWSCTQSPIYDIEKSYLENAEEGPFFTGPYPERNIPPKEKWVDFLGFKVASRLGVPAGPLLNSRWIDFAAKMGFDILTYKTIRSLSYAGHAMPNVIFVEAPQINASIKSLKRREANPSTLDEISITNSFGMPSRTPEYLRKDIPLAQKALKPGQLLIVSITGTLAKGGTKEAYFQDFVDTALLAKECGAQVIEANFSCPNVSKEEGCLYTDSETVFALAKQLTTSLKGTPLIIKVGLLPNREMLYKLLYKATQAGVAAVSGINSISLPVVDSKGLPALGSNRLTSGICGSSIRNEALNFVKLAKEIIDREKLGLTLIGVGGVVLPEHFEHFFSAGADCVQSATGMMWDPYLALRYEALKGELCTSKI